MKSFFMIISSNTSWRQSLFVSWFCPAVMNSPGIHTPLFVHRRKVNTYESSPDVTHSSTLEPTIWNANEPPNNVTTWIRILNFFFRSFSTTSSLIRRELRLKIPFLLWSCHWDLAVSYLFFSRCLMSLFSRSRVDTQKLFTFYSILIAFSGIFNRGGGISWEKFTLQENEMKIPEGSEANLKDFIFTVFD